MKNIKLPDTGEISSILSKKGGKFKLGASPQADWTILFGLFVLLFVSVVLMSVYIFVKIDKGEIFVVESPESLEEETVDLDALRSTVNYYQEKEKRFDTLVEQIK